MYITELALSLIITHVPVAIINLRDEPYTCEQSLFTLKKHNQTKLLKKKIIWAVPCAVGVVCQCS